MKIKCVAIAYSCYVFTEGKTYDIEIDDHYGRLLVIGDHGCFQEASIVNEIAEGIFFVPSHGAVFTSTEEVGDNE